jgi:glycosyltransferase involved in cell wall biosynthesis
VREIDYNISREENSLQKKEDKTVGLKQISLIIPVLQEEKLLDETLSHFTKDLLEKYNIELIVSDGGSKDRTLEIAKKYTEKISEYIGEQRQTISAGRNAGAKISEGEILVFINGDSYPENCEEFFGEIKNWANGKGKFRNCIALTCWVTVPPEVMLLKDRVFYAIHNRYIMLLNFMSIGMGRGECQIVRREYFERVGGYDESLAAGEDFDLFKRLAKLGKIGFIKDIKIFESPRRFRKYGYFKVIMQWIVNSISVMIYKKSVSEEWDPVR